VAAVDAFVAAPAGLLLGRGGLVGAVAAVLRAARARSGRLSAGAARGNTARRSGTG
jgi:hypothetical protein